VCEPWERCVRAVSAPCARCEHAAATACALWKRHGRCKDAMGTLFGRCRDTVRTFYIHAITDTFYILGVFRGDPTARWHGFRTLYKRCGNAVWCDRGFTWLAQFCLLGNLVMSCNICLYIVLMYLFSLELITFYPIFYNICYGIWIHI